MAAAFATHPGESCLGEAHADSIVAAIAVHFLIIGVEHSLWYNVADI